MINIVELNLFYFNFIIKNLEAVTGSGLLGVQNLKDMGSWILNHDHRVSWGTALYHSQHQHI